MDNCSVASIKPLDDCISISVISPSVASIEAAISQTGHFYDQDSDSEPSQADTTSYDAISDVPDQTPDKYIVWPDYPVFKPPKFLREATKKKKQKKKKTMSQKAKKCIGITLMVVIMFGLVIGIISSKVKSRNDAKESTVSPLTTDNVTLWGDESNPEWTITATSANIHISTGISITLENT